MRVAAFFFILNLASVALAAEVKLPGALYQPMFREPGETDSSVGPLWVDEAPVTNQQYHLFLKSHPQYSKSKVISLYADSGYLVQWPNKNEFAKSEAQYPVTNVSWFVARRFCESQGKRLPTIAEWEVASDAQNPKYESEILKWYSSPGAKLRNVGLKTSNKFGLKDSHGLIWEWVDNFAESIMSGDSRGGSPTDSMFCGGASLKAKDPRLYAAFMRFAFRSSLTAKYTSRNLGFRCVRDLQGDLK